MSILYEVQNGVAVLTVDRPEKKNALTQAMYGQLVAGLKRAVADDEVRAVLIAGQPGIFTAGNELTEFLSALPAQGGDAPVFHFMRALAGFEKPIIAAVTGDAVGIGVTLLLHCDLVYMAAGSTLSLPFVKLGLVPEFAASLLLPQRAGYLRAAHALLLGAPIAAEEAVEMGLANMVCPPEQVLDVAREVAERFNALPADAVRETKRLLKQAQAGPVAMAMAEEIRAFSARLGGPEVREAVAAFYEKRAPDFSRPGKGD